MKHGTTTHRIRMSLRGCRPKFSLGLLLFQEEYCLDLFGFLIALPFLDRWHREPHEILEKWGFYFIDRAFVIAWGRETKHINLPWHLEHIKHEVLRADGTWVPFVGSWEDKEPDGRKEETFAYHYALRSGEVQERVATVYVGRREWRQKWLKWCPWFALKCQSIDVRFDDEVGERTGSWKGGVMGTGYEMRPGETPEQTLRRMERERIFD